MHTSRLLAICALLPAMASAAERSFTYVQESAVLAPGQHELELWTTWQGGRNDSDYRQLDSRLEIELGVAPDTQVALYLNHRRSSADGVSESEYEGVSLEVKRRLSDPVADGFGSALYAEGTANGSETELELKGIADWRLGTWYAALNLTGEIASVETESDPASGAGNGTATEYAAELSAALGHRIDAQWSAGIELENRNPIGEKGEWESSTLWLGPAVHLSGPHLWATLTILPQIANLGGDADSGSRELDDHSRVEARLLLGTNF